MNCRISSSLIGAAASPWTLWTDSRYFVIVVLLFVCAARLSPSLRTRLGQIDRPCHQGGSDDKIDENALRALVRSAVALRDELAHARDQRVAFVDPGASAHLVEEGAGL